MNAEPKRTSWVRTAALFLVVAIVFGAAGYLITPRSAQSASLQTRQNLLQVNDQLKMALAGQKKLNKQLGQARDELAQAAERAAAAEESAQTHKTKLAAAEESITQLTGRLDRAGQAGKSLVEARKLAADRKTQAEKAQGQVKTLTVQLAAVRAEGQKLSQTYNTLKAQQAKLAASTNSQQQQADEMKRLLAVLELGEGQVGQTTGPTGPAETPITNGELIRQMGYPTLVFQREGYVEMQWENQHTVWTVGGIVTKIDGEPASRELLATASVAGPIMVGSPAPWRFGQGRLCYADLVSMFGKPEKVRGTGRKFEAYWSIGAWARSVWVTVADGVVTEFDGREADGGVCCELVRHRVGAYKSAGQAVQDSVAAARAAYNRASQVVARTLSAQADKKQRDGVRLVEWKIAPLESVGAWVGPANASAGSATVRAWIDCTWGGPGDVTKTQRRYVVVTLFGKDQPIETAECTIFGPGGQD